MLGSRTNSSAYAKLLYSFPELKSQEILDCLSDLKIPISSDDLNKPSCASTQRLMQAITEYVSADGANTDTQLIYDVAGTTSFPELHVDCLSMLDLFQGAFHLMKALGVDDFSLRDLIRPEPFRMRLILSAFINFAKFREEQLIIMENLSKRNEELRNLKNNLLQKYSETNERLTNMKAILSKEEPLCQDVKEKISHALEELRRLKKSQVALSKELDDLKLEKENLAKKVLPAKSILSTLQSEIAKLSSRLMEDAGLLVETVAKLNETVSSEKGAISLAEKKSRDLFGKLQCLESSIHQLTELLQYLEKIHEELLRSQKMTQDLRRGNQEIEGLSLSLRDVEIKEEYCSRQIASLNEKSNRLKECREERHSSLLLRLSQLQSQYNELSNEKMQSIELYRELDDREKEYSQKLAKLKRLRESEIQALRHEYVTLKSKVDVYFTDLQKDINSPS